MIQVVALPDFLPKNYNWPLLMYKEVYCGALANVRDSHLLESF